MQQRFNLITVAQVINPSKLPCEFIFCFTRLPVSQFFDEFSNVAKCLLHMIVTASFPDSPPTEDGSHDFLLSDVLLEFFGRFFQQSCSHGIHFGFLCGFLTGCQCIFELFITHFHTLKQGSTFGYLVFHLVKVGISGNLMFFSRMFVSPRYVVSVRMCAIGHSFICCHFECINYIAIELF